jgi:ribose 5-phosphate isomerase B
MADPKTLRVALGADHAGYPLKELLKETLDKLGVTYEDLGTHDTSSVDYPDYAFAVARGVIEGRFDRGILFCGTGIGMCIAANKISGIRCVFCKDHYTAAMSRRHNDSNVLAMGAWVVGVGAASDVVEAWLSEEFEGGRHIRRLDKIRAVEESGGDLPAD